MNFRCNQVDHRNQQIMGICVQSTCKYQRPFCNYCLPNHGSHLNQLMTWELLQEWIDQKIILIKDLQKNASDCKSALDSLINKIISNQNLNIQQLQVLGLSQIDNIIKDLSQIEDSQSSLFQQLKESMVQVIQIINEILTNKLKKNTNLQVQQTQNTISQIPQQKNQIDIIQTNLKSFKFELINQNPIQQLEQCYAIAFNNDCTIVAAGCFEKIKLFQHIKGKLDEIQELKEHKQEVYILNFMKNTNNFVSGGEDYLIILWQMDVNNQWICQQKLDEHSGNLFCLLLNNNNDLIISCSSDRTIKFWMKQNQWFCQQTLTDHTDFVFALSLNEQQNKMISCSRDSQIFVIEQSQFDKKWNIIQKISIETWGCRLCFINDSQFTFQPYAKEQMQVYEFDCHTKNFKKINEVFVECGSNSCDFLFQQQYIKSKCLLVNKNGKYINLLRKKENGDFIVEQSIEFDHEGFYGQLSEDGEYLITWAYNSKIIQIRKCQKL
ncbi:unnamed protein product [Paramecium sonneborni]|uniref:WD40-repeat-containing domain n=1 Tax=Paramecium sonneborni TaxID=65129 RepID=A0A8S1QS83_9CILI|nr:unnamed protein product [Paramecium sonneborni]